MVLEETSVIRTTPNVGLDMMQLKKSKQDKTPKEKTKTKDTTKSAKKDKEARKSIKYHLNNLFFVFCFQSVVLFCRL